MILYLDTETTGLYPGQICQLSCIAQTCDCVKAKNLFFTVDSVEYGAYLVHGFSVQRLQELSGGKKFSERIDEVDELLKNADAIVTHNVSFDFMFLRAEYERVGRTLKYGETFCSMKESVPVCKLPRKSGTGYKYPKLSELCEYFDVKNFQIENMTEKLFDEELNYHDARFDSTAVFLAVNEGIKSENRYSVLKKYL